MRFFAHRADTVRTFLAAVLATLLLTLFSGAAAAALVSVLVLMITEPVG